MTDEEFDDLEKFKIHLAKKFIMLSIAAPYVKDGIEEYVTEAAESLVALLEIMR